MADLSADFEALGTTKAELRIAFNDLDDWFEANQIAMNQAISLPARTQLTAKQKAAIFMFILQKRFEVF